MTAEDSRSLDGVLIKRCSDNGKGRKALDSQKTQELREEVLEDQKYAPPPDAIKEKYDGAEQITCSLHFAGRAETGYHEAGSLA